MVLKLYNTLSRTKEPFTPLTQGRVLMYSCGPTVYGNAHIGNLRSFLVNDILRRVLAYAGYEVTHVMNITDIDDKMIKKSAEEGVSLADIAERYEQTFQKDLVRLGIKAPSRLLKATHHIDQMIAFIHTLLKQGYAYASDDGIYFDISKSLGYGSLARLNPSAHTESRIVSDDYDKNNARDFALWKFWTFEDGPNVFEASFGRGRPGWHIECSAMAINELGETLDIHTGGVDLIFPHHTNEIAQSDAITGKPFVRYWIHTEFVVVDSQKMSKSLGNTIILDDIQNRGFSPRAYRYWVLTAHYRTLVNFTWEALDGAQTALQKIFSHMYAYPDGGTVDQNYQNRFKEVIANDLDTPKALALLWELIKDQTISDANKKATLLDFDTVFGLGLADIIESTAPQEIMLLVNQREEARARRDWATADAIRQEIARRGYEIEDTPIKPRIVPKTLHP